MRLRRKTNKPPFFTPRDRENIFWFWESYLKEKSLWLILVLAMVAIQGLVYRQFLILTENGLRIMFESGQLSDLVRISAAVFALFAMRALMSYVSSRLSVWLASDAVLKMRGDLITHLVGLDLAYFERTKAGDHILRLVSQAQELSAFVGQTTVKAVGDAATVLIVSSYLIYKSPLLFLTMIVVTPIIILLMQWVSTRIKTIQRNAENAMGNFMGGIEEMTNGMRTVKISSQESVERERLLSSATEIRNISIELQKAQALILPTIDLSSAFVYTFVIGGGGYMVISPNYDIDGAAIISFLIGMALVFDPARLLAQFFGHLQANLVILDGVRSLYNEHPTITDSPNATSDFDTSGDIILDSVKFQYAEDVPLFEDLNMVFKGGQVTAIVGATGSGKTTVLSLIARLYNIDADDGSISISGQDINTIKVKSLRRSFSVVAQDIVIFNNSVWENIRYVRPEATDEEIWAAADSASISDLIRIRGDAPLGPKGSQLSGGQKQRIAIARAFLRSAPILLLDEATSALDQKTEERVKRALGELSVNKTTLIVAHRLSTVTHADKIYVVDGGKVIESGTHATLLASSGLYASMYEAQKQSYD